MPADKSQLETVTLNETPAIPLNETTLPQQSNLIGQTLDERYFIESELGQGGVGVVYLASDHKLHDKHVVIKILLEKSLDRKSTRLNSSHLVISYAVFCLKKKK